MCAKITETKRYCRSLGSNYFMIVLAAVLDARYIFLHIGHLFS